MSVIKLITLVISLQQEENGIINTDHFTKYLTITDSP